MSEKRSLSGATPDNSEDETFKRLCRTPFPEISAYFLANFWEFYSQPVVFNNWLSRHGWTKDKFVEEGLKRDEERNAR